MPTILMLLSPSVRSALAAATVGLYAVVTMPVMSLWVAINQALATHKDITGIVTTAYNPTVAAAKALRTLGDKKIKMVGIDDDPVVLQAVKDGFLIGTMGQNPYGQAYIASYGINQIHQGCKKKSGAPYFIDSGTLLISPDKTATYPGDFKSLTNGILATFQA